MVHHLSSASDSVSASASSTFLDIFFETVEPIETRLHVEPPWGGGTKVCSLGLDHMTKMIAMPLYGKNL